MDLRHQSSAMCNIMLGGEDTHPWSATKVGNPIPATIPVTKKNNKLLKPAGTGRFGKKDIETFRHIFHAETSRIILVPYYLGFVLGFLQTG